MTVARSVKECRCDPCLVTLASVGVGGEWGEPSSFPVRVQWSSSSVVGESGGGGGVGGRHG